MSGYLRPRRLFALLGKEFVQILRDPSAIMIAFVMPVILLLLNGYGLSLDAMNVSFGVVMEAQTPRTISLYRAFVDTPYIAAHPYYTADAAESALMNGDIKGYIVVRAETVRNLDSALKPQPYLVVVDGVDANTARIVEGYAAGVLGGWYQREASNNSLLISSPGVVLEHRYWFNPELRSTSFIVPGLIAVVMTLVGALLTAMIVSREWERGTMESLMASPASILEVMLSKLLSNFVLGMMAMAVAVFLGLFLFHVPFRGSFLILTLVSALFLISALALGLLISTIARNQFVAAQITFITTYMPALMLSGLLFDIASMPLWVQDLTHIVAARYFVACLQTLFLAGDVSAILLPNAVILFCFALGFSLITLKRMKRNLEG
ncbi:MAG TPA: ABC transporter permease [Terriglobia bacterium]|nr:ABC transporter permease [Terriglobia bacterium]